MSVSGTVIEEDGFGLVPRPDPSASGKLYGIVKRYTLTNKQRASVQLISWGAGIQSIRVPNRSGILGDVVLGFDSMDGYLKNRYMGSIIGQVVNDVSDDKTCGNNGIRALTANDGVGGGGFPSAAIDFDNVNWESYILNKQVVMSYLKEPREKYSGYLLMQAKYSWTDDNQLRINIRATTTKPRPTNITNCCFLNLAGHGTGAEELRKHVVTVNGDNWISGDGETGNLPTGVTRPVHRTVYDLQLPTQLTPKKLYAVPGGGYNRGFCINGPSSCCYRFHARILHPGSGRTLEVYSNQPCLWFSTGNHLPDPDRVYPPDLEDYVHSEVNGSSLSLKSGREVGENGEIRGKNGICYRRHGGFVLSPRNYPGFDDVDGFPSYFLYPGGIYRHDLTYKFGVLSVT